MAKLLGEEYIPDYVPGYTISRKEYLDNYGNYESLWMDIKSYIFAKDKIGTSLGEWDKDVSVFIWLVSGEDTWSFSCLSFIFKMIFASANSDATRLIELHAQGESSVLDLVAELDGPVSQEDITRERDLFVRAISSIGITLSDPPSYTNADHTPCEPKMAEAALYCSIASTFSRNLNGPKDLSRMDKYVYMATKSSCIATTIVPSLDIPHIVKRLGEMKNFLTNSSAIRNENEIPECCTLLGVACVCCLYFIKNGRGSDCIDLACVDHGTIGEGGYDRAKDYMFDMDKYRVFSLLSGYGSNDRSKIYAFCSSLTKSVIDLVTRAKLVFLSNCCDEEQNLFKHHSKEMDFMRCCLSVDPTPRNIQTHVHIGDVPKEALSILVDQLGSDLIDSYSDIGARSLSHSNVSSDTKVIESMDNSQKTPLSELSVHATSPTTSHRGDKIQQPDQRQRDTLYRLMRELEASSRSFAIHYTYGKRKSTGPHRIGSHLSGTDLLPSQSPNQIQQDGHHYDHEHTKQNSSMAEEDYSRELKALIEMYKNKTASTLSGTTTPHWVSVDSDAMQSMGAKNWSSETLQGWFVEKFSVYWQNFTQDGCSLSKANEQLVLFLKEAWLDNGHQLESLNVDATYRGENSHYASLVLFLRYGMVYLKNKWEKDALGLKEEEYTRQLEEYRKKSLDQRCPDLVDAFFDFEEKSLQEVAIIKERSTTTINDHENIMHDRNVQSIKSIGINPLHEREYLTNFEYLRDMAVYFTLRKTNKGGNEMIQLSRKLKEKVTGIVKWIEKERSMAYGNTVTGMIGAVMDWSYSVDEDVRVEPFVIAESMEGDLNCVVFDFMPDDSEYFVEVSMDDESSVLKERLEPSQYGSTTGESMDTTDIEDLVNGSVKLSDGTEAVARSLLLLLGDSLESRLKSYKGPISKDPRMMFVSQGVYPYSNHSQLLLDLLSNMARLKQIDYVYVKLFLQCAVWFGLIRISRGVSKPEASYYNGFYTPMTHISVLSEAVLGDGYDSQNFLHALSQMGSVGSLSRLRKFFAGWKPLIHNRKTRPETLKNGHLDKVDSILEQYMRKEGGTEESLRMYKQWMTDVFPPSYENELERHFALLDWLGINDRRIQREIICSLCFEYLYKKTRKEDTKGMSVIEKRLSIFAPEKGNEPNRYNQFTNTDQDLNPRTTILYSQIDPLRGSIRRWDTRWPKTHSNHESTRGSVVEDLIIERAFAIIALSEALDQADVSRYLYFVSIGMGLSPMWNMSTQ